MESLLPRPVLPPAAPGDFLEHQGNWVHRRARYMGNVSLKQACFLPRGAIIRGDIAKVSLGSYVVLGEGAVVRPPLMLRDGGVEAFPVTLGDFIYIGAGAICEASVVGSGVLLGDGCVIGPRSAIANTVVVLPGSVVPAGASLGPFGIYRGNPALRVGELPMESSFVDIRDWIMQTLGSFGASGVFSTPEATPAA